MSTISGTEGPDSLVGVAGGGFLNVNGLVGNDTIATNGGYDDPGGRDAVEPDVGVDLRDVSPRI